MDTKVDYDNQDAENKLAGIEHDEVADARGLKEDAYNQEALEANMTIIEAVKAYPMATFWAFIMSFTIVMESFDMFLIGNFVALPAFKDKYGTFVDEATGYVIPTKWQTALTQAGQIGAFLGVFMAGPITTRLGYRWTTMIGLMLMNATIFISFFANSLPVFLIGQLFEGMPWGLFIAVSPAYASEVVPLPLRGACTATLQMCWAFGSIIVGAVTYVLNQRNDQWAYRIPLAVQWAFPTPLLILMWFAPESPWWLIRRGRKAEALRSVERLGRASMQNSAEIVAMMSRTVEIEAALATRPSYMDLLKGTDLRRTLITCFIYAGQNFAGNLIANQAVFFFVQAGMTTDFAFALGLITSCLQVIAVACSWVLSSYFGRRTIYLYGTAANITFLFALGIAATVKQSSNAQFAQACLGVIISFTFALTLGPISYTIIAETSSVRLRPLSTAVGRAAYYIAEIPCIYLASQMLNPTGWNLAGKCGFIWGGTAVVCFVTAFFALPELRGRSYREIDILFRRKISARKFSSTEINMQDDD